MDYDELAELASEMASPTDGLEIKSRKYLLKTYHKCFVGSDAVTWLCRRKNCSRPAGVALGNQLWKAGLLSHCIDPAKPFLDGYFFYRFSKKVQGKKGRLKGTAIPTTTIGIARFMADDMHGVEVKDRKYHLKTYKMCFVAHDAIDWMLKNLAYRTRDEAVDMCNQLVSENLIEHVCDPQPLQDSYLFFRFTERVYQKSEVESVEEKPISVDDFTKIALLGEGGYGKVWLVRMNSSKKVYAMKVLEKAKIRSPKALEHIITEKQVLVNNSPFLLHLHFSFQTPSKLYLVTDYLAGGDMFFHLAKKNGSGFSTKVAQFFAAELVLSIEHLHLCGVIYRDLKLENVLLDEQGHVCLADFGLSKVLDSTDTTQTFCGSQGYLAPEILRGETYSYAVDWFSLGVILFEMVSGTNPFLGADFHETCRNILHKNISFPTTIFSKSLVNLLQRLLARNANERLQTGSEIKRHPWFKSIDWDKLEVKKVKPPFKISVKAKDSTENFDDCFTQMEITDEQESTDTESDSSSAIDDVFQEFNYASPTV